MMESKFNYCRMAWLVVLCGWALFPLQGKQSDKEGRYTLSLSGEGWYVWQDKEAQWKNDRLYLPKETSDLSLLPVNPPTGGWNKLCPQNATPVHVPGTLEEFFTASDNPRPEDGIGVSWWFRKIRLPETLAGRRFLIHFESVRMRAEIYLDGRLVGYDIVGESPFDVDITSSIRLGKEQMLAIRVTHPGGNFHWQDFDAMQWGNYQLPPGRSFGGLIGRVSLDAVSPVYVKDIYMQNQPNPSSVKARLSIDNCWKEEARGSLCLSVYEKNHPDRILIRKEVRKFSLKKGENLVTVGIDCPEAKLWDLDHPNLYTCRVELKLENRMMDNAVCHFGFRWFEPVGIGRNAQLQLNGHRVMLRTAISWGYWPVTGLYASPEMAEKQIYAAKELGLNMLNFHRSIGSSIVLEKADELGLLYYEEPGGFHSAGHDPFIREVVNLKLQRMIRRDRSHPSLVIYNLINEWGGVKARDKELTAKRMEDMKKAHALDPSRVITFTSGWAGSEHKEEDAKAHMLPFDTLLYRKGWFDNHRAGGPATWETGYYRGVKDNLMYTDNQTEIFMRGEEGALSAPPRIALIHHQLQCTGKTGWDGLLWESQYATFEDYFRKKALQPYFGTIDSLTRAMGDVSFDHQGRRLQGMRMQNVGDVYAVNGWEAMPYDNHSGIVDIYRNAKGNLSAFTRYVQPLYVAVSPRSQIVSLPGNVLVDFHIVNECNLSGTYTLVLTLCHPNGGAVVALGEKEVKVRGGDSFGEMLYEGCKASLTGSPGLYRIEANLLDAQRRVCATGYDEVLGVHWRQEQLRGNGAVYGSMGNSVAAFYQQATGRSLPDFRPDMGRLDWIVVTRPPLDDPLPVPEEAFKKGENGQACQLTLYKDDDLGQLAGVTADNRISRTFADGAQPDSLLPANQSFSAVWSGTLIAPQSGVYLIGVTSAQGVRLMVGANRLVDEWRNKKEITIVRPVALSKGEEVPVRVEYSQRAPKGAVQLVWSLPNQASIPPRELLDRVEKDGTSLLLLESAEAWMDAIGQVENIGYHGCYVVGKNWVGGLHFVKSHPLFKDLPTNVAMGWPYQVLVRDGDRRLGLLIEKEEMVVGSYASMPFHLGSAVGIIPHGKGRIYYSTLNLVSNLTDPSPEAEVARKLFCNFVDFCTGGVFNR